MVADEALAGAVGAINDRLQASMPGLKIALVDPKSLKRLEKNARYMTREQFNTLVSNIKRDQFLSSVPFCVKKGDSFHVLSGNHRVKASVEAGITEILILYTDAPISRDREVAIVLSHNAISGQDDPTMLRQLWDEIQDISEKVYSGLDDKKLGEIDGLSGSALNPVRLDYRTVTFLMLPEEKERLDVCLDIALQATGTSDAAYIGRLDQFERLLVAMGKVQKAKNVKNSAVSLGIILDLFEAAWAQQQQEAEATAAGE